MGKISNIVPTFDNILSVVGHTPLPNVKRHAKAREFKLHALSSELLSVTWHKTSENIYFKGEKGNDLTKRVYSFLTASESAAVTADPVEAELEKSMENLLADDVEVTSDNIFNEPFCLAVSTPARVLKPIARGEAAKELGNRHCEHEEAISNLESTKASSKPTNENLHRGLPILHTATKSDSPSGSIDKSINVRLKLVY